MTYGGTTYGGSAHGSTYKHSFVGSSDVANSSSEALVPTVVSISEPESDVVFVNTISEVSISDTASDVSGSVEISTASPSVSDADSQSVGSGLIQGALLSVNVPEATVETTGSALVGQSEAFPTTLSPLTWVGVVGENIHVQSDILSAKYVNEIVGSGAVGLAQADTFVSVVNADSLASGEKSQATLTVYESTNVADSTNRGELARSTASIFDSRIISVESISVSNIATSDTEVSLPSIVSKTQTVADVSSVDVAPFVASIESQSETVGAIIASSTTVSNGLSLSEGIGYSIPTEAVVDVSFGNIVAYASVVGNTIAAQSDTTQPIPAIMSSAVATHVDFSLSVAQSDNISKSVSLADNPIIETDILPSTIVNVLSTAVSESTIGRTAPTFANAVTGHIANAIVTSTRAESAVPMIDTLSVGVGDSTSAHVGISQSIIDYELPTGTHAAGLNKFNSVSSSNTINSTTGELIGFNSASGSNTINSASGESGQNSLSK